MKLLYVLAALPLLAIAAPAPVPSGYPSKRAIDPVYAKRQLTVAELKRRAEDSSDDHDDHHYKPSGYMVARATPAA